MKKKLIKLFIVIIATVPVVKADYMFDDQFDYTGDALFTNSTPEKQVNAHRSSGSGTIPPVKKMRLKIKNYFYDKEMQNSELAPTSAPVYPVDAEASEYVSQEEPKKFEDEVTMPDGFEADEEAIAESEKKKQFFFRKKDKIKKTDGTEDIILDCEKVEYDTLNYLIFAKGNASVKFVKQNTTVFANLITFDRVNNTIKAEENVKIIRNGQTVTGDYIFVDMNEENALIENPITDMNTIKIKSKKGYVYSDKIVQEEGNIVVDKSFPLNFRSGNRGPRLDRMLIPKGQTLEEDMEKGIIKVNAKDIKIAQKGDLEIITVKRMKVLKGDKTIFKTPKVKIYTNKNHDYAETGHWEFGAYRGLGAYAGPGVVVELPKGSVFKAIPMVNYKSGIGVGAVGRFSSGTNQTTIAYGTAAERLFLYGKQKLDDKLIIQYGINSYQNEWFLGRRRPKYGIGLVYKNGYAAKDFLIKGQVSSFQHRVDAGFYHDMDYDKHFEKINGVGEESSRFRYMAQASQSLFNYKNEEKLTAAGLNLVGQLSTAVYGTGDTQVITRFGPNIHLQYKRWMQDVGFMFSAYDDNTPMPVYDAYRYGKQSIFFREYFRVCKYLTLAWFANINLDDRTLNGERFQENGFYIAVGPEDIKLNLGYDFIRENLYCTFAIMTDAKGTKVEYEKMEIKQTKKSANKEEKITDHSYIAPTQPKTLQKAIVEDIKVVEDVL